MHVGFKRYALASDLQRLRPHLSRREAMEVPMTKRREDNSLPLVMMVSLTFRKKACGRQTLLSERRKPSRQSGFCEEDDPQAQTLQREMGWTTEAWLWSALQAYEGGRRS